MTRTYQKIAAVLLKFGGPFAAHDFRYLIWDVATGQDALNYVGCSESALGRRLREMRATGMVTSTRRQGTAFVVYALPVREPEVAA